MKTTGKVNGIISNIVIVKADGAVGQNEICYVYAGETKMMAEVIKVIGDDAYVQVFDSTRGLKIGDKVEFEGHMLPIPVGYDGYLSMAFGDYMQLPPEEKQVCHHEYEFMDMENSYQNYRGKYYYVNQK